MQINRKKWVNSFLVFCSLWSLTGCSDAEKATDLDETSQETTYVQSNAFEPGTYTAEAEGNGGPIVIEVTFDEAAIREIEIIRQSETEGLGDVALEQIKEDIIDNQSLTVDTVSGASEASSAILAAVEDAVLQAGGNPDLMKSTDTTEQNDTVEELNTDVVVIGGGASGTSAAVSAGDSGANVILIEKTGTIGGASNFSWAGKLYNSSVSLENDIEVDLENEIEEWIENNHWRVDASVIRKFVTESGETYDWLSEKGYDTSFLNLGGEQMHVLPEMDSREEILRNMLAESVEANGGKVLTTTTAKELITSDDGEVTGVTAVKEDGTTINIAAKTVIVATGGYAGNEEMVEEAFGFKGVNGGLAQNVGEGLEMSWEAGAKVPINFGGQMLHQTLAKATSDLKEEYTSYEASYPLMLTYLPNVMNVGASGARFRNEEATLSSVAAANTSAFQGEYHYVIVSQSQLDELENGGMEALGVADLPGMPPEFYSDFQDQFQLDNSWSNVTEVFNSMVESGNGYKGETIEELAEAAGMDSQIFSDTFNAYQEAIETGIDSDFGKDAAYLTSMGEAGPYYAITAEINNLGSLGGLVVNNQFQVLNDENLPVKGLYAVGLEAEGVLYNDTYVGNGIGVGFAFTSGRLGGRYAAEEALAAE